MASFSGAEGPLKEREGRCTEVLSSKTALGGRTQNVDRHQGWDAFTGSVFHVPMSLFFIRLYFMRCAI